MSLINGVVIGLVTNVKDPEKNGRIKVHFPWLDDNHETDWIRIATMMGGNGRGSFFMPEVNDEVLVAFDHGDARFPYVIGFMWNGQDAPPADDVRIRRIESVNGHRISFLDSTPSGGNKGGLLIEDAHGNTILMSNAQIVVKSVCNLQVIAPTITLNGRVVAPNANPI
ncbi:MAG: hypothetical protein JO347_06450 [Candidatus Eremiobacteraeota bacterium]|nr:hypothetical protein [Candidatus Eremiobacteraeota bacterium]